MARGLVLLSTYEGAAHIGAQLESLAAQTRRDFRLVVSDDGSRDGTPAQVAAFAAQAPFEVVQHDGPRGGFVANFLSLLARVGSGAERDPDWVALCDQDDVWLPEKLEVAAAALGACAPGSAALYCSRTWVWDAARDRRLPSRAYPRRPSAQNALIENIAPGHTIVLNRAAWELAQACAPHAGGVYAHDWWLYLLVTAAGGTVVHDPTPRVLYRQHGANQIGHGTRAGHGRLVWQGAFAARVSGNIAALAPVSDRLTPEARALLAGYSAARALPARARLRALADLGVYRQTLRGQIGFWGAAALGKV